MSKKKLSNAIKPASILRKQYYGDEELIDYVCDILISLEDSILLAIENGQTETIMEIPTAFTIGQMEFDNAQKHVYFNLAKELKKKGYLPKFKYIGKKSNKQKVFLKVSWLTEKDENYNKFIECELSKMVFDWFYLII